MIKKILLVVVLSLSFSSIFSQSISEQNRRKKEIEDEIAFLDKQLSQNKFKQQANTKELNFIKRKITNRKKLLLEIEREIKQIDSLVKIKESQVSMLQTELGFLKKKYSKLIYSSYKQRDQNIWIMYILASDNFGQGYRRWVYFKNYASAMREKASAIRSTGELISKEKESLDKMKSKSLAVQNQKKQEYKKLENEEKSAKNIINNLSKKEKEFKQQLSERKREMDRLNREIEKILTTAVSAKKSPGYKESPADKLISDKFENNKGRLPWPVKKGVIVDEFGQHFHPVFKNIKLPFNNGITIATDPNSDALCVFDGVVKQILYMPGYSQCVLVQHGNFYTFYCKLDRVSVKAGDKVSTGQVIGSLAESDGNSSIHFQLWNGVTKQNPENWLAK